MIDKITEALDNWDYVTGIFLDFPKPLIRWIMKYYFTSYLIMELGGLLLIGLKATHLTGANLLLITVSPQLQN